MRQLLAAVLVCLPLSAAFADDKNQKEVSLFDGKTLTGWHVMNGGKFEAKDGVIQLRGGSGWLRSEKEYSDFVLSVEVRWLKEKQDSGIFLRSGTEGKNWPDKKIEVQVENTERVAMLFGAKHKLDKEKAAKAIKPVNEWNEYLWPFLMSDDSSVAPLPVGLTQLQNNDGVTNWGPVMAGTVLTMLPILVVFLALQRHMIKGLTSGAVKG